MLGIQHSIACAADAVAILGHYSSDSQKMYRCFIEIRLIIGQSESCRYLYVERAGLQDQCIIIIAMVQYYIVKCYVLFSDVTYKTGSKFIFLVQIPRRDTLHIPITTRLLWEEFSH